MASVSAPASWDQIRSFVGDCRGHEQVKEETVHKALRVIKCLEALCYPLPRQGYVGEHAGEIILDWARGQVLIEGSRGKRSIIWTERGRS